MADKVRFFIGIQKAISRELRKRAIAHALLYTAYTKQGVIVENDNLAVAGELNIKLYAIAALTGELEGREGVFGNFFIV